MKTYQCRTFLVATLLSSFLCSSARAQTAPPVRGVNGEVHSIAVDASGNVYVGGTFTVAGNIYTRNIAKYNPSTKTWSPLNDGLWWDTPGTLGGQVRSIKIGSNGKVYIGGKFGDGNVAVWNPVNSTFDFVDGGVYNSDRPDVHSVVNGIDSDNNGFVVYAGGSFSLAGGISSPNMAQHISTGWVDYYETSLFPQQVRVGVGVHGRLPYISDISGGVYYSVDDFPPNNWHQVDPNVIGAVFDFLLEGPLPIGGSFHVAGQQGYNFALYNGSGYAIVPGGPTVSTPVNALAMKGTNTIYMTVSQDGNWGIQIGSTSYLVNGVAAYDLTTGWSLLGNGTANGVIGPAFAVAVSGNLVYVGGSFTQTASGVCANNIAVYDTSTGTWSELAANAAPTVALTSPANNAQFAASANITLSATASDDCKVASVSFYQGTTLLGTDTTAPYSFTWNNVPPGTYSLTASATDDEGAVTVSTPVTITVSGLIDVDFGGNASTSSKTGFAQIGETSSDFWNFYTCDDGQGGRRNGGTLSNLKYANGVVSGVSLTVDNAPGLWATSSTDPMYGPYIYPSSGNATVTVNNLPAGSYGFFIYGYDGNYQLSVITDYGTKTSRESPVVSPPNWQSGVQYALFSGVTVGGGQELDLTVRNGLDGYAIIAGMQVLQGSSLLDLDFGSGTSSSKTGLAAIGQSTSDFWNFYNVGSGSVLNLKYANGTSSGVNLYVNNAGGVWANGSSDPMYNDYVYPSGGGSASIALKNLSAGSYSVYAYSQDGNYQLSAATDYGTKSNLEWPIVNPPNWQNGVQFSRFSLVNVNAGQAVRITLLPGVYGTPLIAGLQIRNAF